MHHQESPRRMKSTIFWLWMFKSFQRCWAGRWANTNEYPHTSRWLWSAASNNIRDEQRSSSYTRLGRFALQDGANSRNFGSDIAWKLWGKHSKSAQQRQQLHTAARFVPPVVAASLARSSARTQNEPRLAHQHHDDDETLDEYHPGDNEYDDYYYDENDDNIFYLQEDVVAVRKNPTRHGHLATTATATVTTTPASPSIEEVVPASIKLRVPKRRNKQPAAITESTEEQQQSSSIFLTQPIVPISVSLEEETGEMFADPANMNRLVESGLDMVRLQTNEWIEWKMDSSSKKLLQDKSEREVLEQGDVLVYVGTAKHDGHGSNLPIIKTKSLLPICAHDMAELLMDSSRVKIYNKLSLGRTDVRTLGGAKNDDATTQTTKIVCNLTKPPIAKSKMISCTMMHSRKLASFSTKRDDDDVPRETYLVVSRAAPGMIDDDMKELPRNDILLGVNLLEDIGNHQCIMTAVTHVYSPALPTMLAKSMGVSSAINFVKDIRKSCEETAAAQAAAVTTKIR